LWYGEQLAGVRDIGGAIGFGEQAVVADAVEAVWQYVDEEAAEHGPSNFTNQLTAIH
jgi:hypothetical protein